MQESPVGKNGLIDEYTESSFGNPALSLSRNLGKLKKVNLVLRTLLTELKYIALTRDDTSYDSTRKMTQLDLNHLFCVTRKFESISSH